MFDCNFILCLSTPDAELPDLDKSFFGDGAWKELDKYLGQDEDYALSRYERDEPLVSKKNGKTYKLWVGMTQGGESNGANQ